MRRALAKADGIGRHWSSTAATVDAFDAKADALAVLAAAGAPMQALQVVPGGRPGFIPAAAAPSRSGRRTCSAISANCIRARSRRSKAEGPLVAFEVILETHPGAEGKADARQAGARTVAVPAGRARFRLRRRRAT